MYIKRWVGVGGGWARDVYCFCLVGAMINHLTLWL